MFFLTSVPNVWPRSRAEIVWCNLGSSNWFCVWRRVNGAYRCDCLFFVSLWVFVCCLCGIPCVWKVICFDNIFVVLMRGEVDFVCSLCGALCSLLSVWFEYFVVCVVRVFWSFVFL